jgi:hypothetical protein
MLPEHAFDIGLVVDDDNVRTQFALRSDFCPDVARGSVTTNFVNTPGSVSMSIVLPPCRFTMMS